jgi:hypothetical protein
LLNFEQTELSAFAPYTESGSQSSDDESFDGKKQNNNVVDVVVEYSANIVENWHDDMVLPPRYPTIKEYDELQFPAKV